MSDRKVSRAHKVYLHPPVELRTWLDVKRALPNVKGLNRAQCADCISALNTIGNLHRLPGEKPKDVDLALARMEADPRLVTNIWIASRPRGIAQGRRWNNITSRVRMAMVATGAGPRIGNRVVQSPTSATTSCRSCPIRRHSAPLCGGERLRASARGNDLRDYREIRPVVARRARNAGMSAHYTACDSAEPQRCRKKIS